MKRLLLILMLLPQTAWAQSRVDTVIPPFAGDQARHVADVASWVTVSAALALDAKVSWDAPDRTKSLALFGVRAGLNYGAATLVKKLTHRVRPDGSNDESFYSLHTAYGFSTMGGPRLAFVLPLAVSTGGLRIAAGKHWLTDVLAGAGVGFGTSFIR